MKLVQIGHGGDQCMRWWRIKTPLVGVRLHHWIKSDRPGYSHDHPWSFVTLVLRGGYVDVSMIDGVEIRDRLRAGSIRLRRAEHEHRVIEAEGCWTIIFMGRTRRHGRSLRDGVEMPFDDWLKEVCE